MYVCVFIITHYTRHTETSNFERVVIYKRAAEAVVISLHERRCTRNYKLYG